MRWPVAVWTVAATVALQGCTPVCGPFEPVPDLQVRRGVHTSLVDPYPASPAFAGLPHRGGEDFRVTVDADGTRVVVRYVKDGVEVEEVWRVAAVETTY